MESAALAGPFSGPWKIRPARLNQSAHGERNAVSGTYGYLLRLTYQGSDKASAATRNLLVTTVFQHNPQALPALTAGKNELEYQAAREVRRELPVRLDQVDRIAHKVTNATYAAQRGQASSSTNVGPPARLFLP